ncbi:hypothetical protein EDD17DRAFT_1507724 [Pisolithus thermaeus]|nr:hypothetical protein EV401DRAFT_1883088 [Pisolithus croceorrhizus]KAI6162864.1 hypothetical protein EDD17DRAFT_1507724 [Pisolithus thermaeus]
MCILARTPYGEMDDCSTLRMSAQWLTGPSKVFCLFLQAISTVGGKQLNVWMYVRYHQGREYDVWHHPPLMSSGTSLRRKDMWTGKRGERGRTSWQGGIVRPLIYPGNTEDDVGASLFQREK